VCVCVCIGAGKRASPEKKEKKENNKGAWAVVTFEDAASASAAMTALKGATIEGRVVHVQFAERVLEERRSRPNSHELASLRPHTLVAEGRMP
jgi:hypothetical protein